MYDVITVENAHDWKEFLSVQKKVYGRRSYMTPLPDYEVRRLLDEAANPALQNHRSILLVVRRKGEAIGRCSLSLPRNGNSGTAMFGFFECLDDAFAARSLLAKAEEICSVNGFRALHGPFSPTTSGITGIQLDHFTEPNVLYEACSPAYYPALLTQAGYGLEQCGRTWRNVTVRSDMEALLARLPDRPSRYTTRQFSQAELHEGIKDLAGLFEIAFQENWSRESMHTDEYFYVARFLLPAWRPESFTLVYDEGMAVGAAVCFPDVNPVFRGRRSFGRTVDALRAQWYARRSRTLITFAIGVHPEYQNSAAGLALARHFARIARQYDTMYSTWITEGNTASERMALRFGLAPWKTFGVYRKNFRNNE